MASPTHSKLLRALGTPLFVAIASPGLGPPDTTPLALSHGLSIRPSTDLVSCGLSSAQHRAALRVPIRPLTDIIIAVRRLPGADPSLRTVMSWREVSREDSRRYKKTRIVCVVDLRSCLVPVAVHTPLGGSRHTLSHLEAKVSGAGSP